MRLFHRKVIIFGFTAIALNSPVFAQSDSSSLPTGPGLSKLYPGDAGIEKDKAVLFTENFESGTVEELGKRWNEISNNNSEALSFAGDVPGHSSGKRSLQITATLDKNTGGHLYKLLSRGVDRLHARFYVKFAEEAEYIHHFVHLGGQRPPLRWPHPRAGTKPDGDDWFSVGIEPAGRYGRHPAPGVWNFYTYWQEMKVSAGQRYWGNSLHPVKPQQVPRNRWQCVEVMIKLNSAVDKSDGELALWLDGKPVAQFYKGVQRGKWTGMGFDLVERDGEPFEGFRFRTHDDLKINYFWLLHYVTRGALRQNRVADPKSVNRVWFDDIVLATKYIGPIQETKSD